MKIRKLILKNINSLYGKWEIDFENEVLRDGGIFAVTGSTGSGKTSILDAVCLALYAETPRLPSGVNAEVVSKGMNECLAELTFLDAHGQEWTASFSYSAIRQGKNKGNMAGQYSHRLMKGAEVVEDKTRGVNRKVEELTGLDKTRFCRAVLLAQGKFDAFLDAGNEKGEILEQITGTEIYSQITQALKKRYDSEKHTLETLEAGMRGIVILTPEERAQKEERMQTLQTEIHNVKEQMKESDALCKLFDAFHTAETDLRSAELKKQETDAEFLAFEPERIRLKEAEKAASCTGKYNILNELRKEQGKDAESLESRTAELQEISGQIQSAESEKAVADREKAERTEQSEALRKIVPSVIAMDQNLLNWTGQANKFRSSIRAEEKRKKEKETSVRDDETALENLKTARVRAEEYLKTHARDSELPEHKPLWLEKKSQYRKQLLLLAGKEAEIANLQKEEALLRKKLTESEKNVAAERGKTEALEEKLAQNNRTRQTLLDGSTMEKWRERVELLQKNIALAEKVRSLEEERKHLVSGAACPLCGSTEHPYCTEPLPEPTREQAELEKAKLILKRLENLETAIHETEKQILAAQASLQKAETENQLTRNAMDQNRAQLEVSNTARTQIHKDMEEIRTELFDALKEFALVPDETELLPADLDRRIQAFLHNTEELAGFERKKQAVSEHLAAERVTLTEIEKQLAQAASELQINKDLLAKESAERIALFGNKDPNAETSLAAERLKTAESAAQCKALVLTQLKERQTLLAETSARLREAMGTRTEQMGIADTAFRHECEHAGITPETYPRIVLPEEERVSLTAKNTQLNQKKTQIEQTLSACREKFDKLKTMIPQDRTEDAIRAGHAEKDGILQAKNQEYGGLNAEIVRDEEDKRRKASQLEALETKKKEFSTWKLLYDYIGAKDSFQRIAQGITLERLLVLANIELKKLSNRYLLISAKTEPLGIDVMDRDQGDLIRPCKNLSGGERFLVSLSLALGLSRMAGEKIRVDSLFMDEGFGTLDPDSLQIALNALETLRNSGKMVGIISHVTGIGESIPCVIEVTKEGGGRSSISGPGVRRLD